MMLRVFGENNPAFEQDSISTIFTIFDLLDPAQFHELKRVNKDWREIINLYRDRFVLYMAILKECNLFATLAQRHLHSVTRLSGGMTNITFLFKARNKQYIGRVPGNNTSKFISRQAECHNIRVANQLGIAAKLVFDKLTGVQVTKFLSNPEPMSRESLRKRENITLCMQPLKQLHTSGERFHADTDVFQRNKIMLNILMKLQACNNAMLSFISDDINSIEKLLSLRSIKKVPCHNDTTPSNFIKSKGSVKLIDWEYANNNDPMWDLACLSMEAGFTEQQDKDMLEDYFGIYPIDNYYHFILYKPVVEYWTMLWAEVQIANKNYVDKSGLTALQEMAATRRKSCLDWLNHAEFKTACQFFETNNHESASYYNPR